MPMSSSAHPVTGMAPACGTCVFGVSNEPRGAAVFDASETKSQIRTTRNPSPATGEAIDRVADEIPRGRDAVWLGSMLMVTAPGVGPLEALSLTHGWSTVAD